GLLHERLAECRGAREIPAVIGDGPRNLERTRVGRSLDGTLGVGLRRLVTVETELHDRTLDARVGRVVGIDRLGGKIERRRVVESVGSDAARGGEGS